MRPSLRNWKIHLFLCPFCCPWFFLIYIKRTFERSKGQTARLPFASSSTDRQTTGLAQKCKEKRKKTKTGRKTCFYWLMVYVHNIRFLSFFSSGKGEKSCNVAAVTRNLRQFAPLFSVSLSRLAASAQTVGQFPTGFSVHDVSRPTESLLKHCFNHMFLISISRYGFSSPFRRPSYFKIFLV